MADLSLIPYISHWIILVVLARKPAYLLLLFTFGVYFAAISWTLTDHDDNYVDSVNDWDWFNYVKRTSVLIGYFGYIYVYISNSKRSAIVFQIILSLNVLEAAILTLQHFEIIVGILLIIICPFSPYIYRNEADNTYLGKSGNITQNSKYNYFSTNWYIRSHLIIIGSWGISSIAFNEYSNSLSASLSCFIPLLMNEYYLNQPINNFNVRTFFLIIGAAIDSSFDTDWNNKQPSNIIPHSMNIYLRNFLQLLLILVLFGLVMVNDKFRRKETSYEERENNERKEAVEAQINGENVPMMVPADDNC